MSGQLTTFFPIVSPPISFTNKPRPKVIHGSTYKINTPVGVAFIILNTNDNNPPEPMEIFINIGKAGSDISAMAEGLGRMISTTFRFSFYLPVEERIKEIIAQLKGIGGSRTMGFGKNQVRSLPDAVAKILSMHYGLKSEKELSGGVEEKPKLITEVS